MGQTGGNVTDVYGVSGGKSTKKTKVVNTPGQFTRPSHDKYSHSPFTITNKGDFRVNDRLKHACF